MTARIPIETVVAFDTFTLKKNRLGLPGKYQFLETMPVGAHFHFSGILGGALRRSISLMNAHLRGKGIHFSVHKVGDDDPKGPGFRVLRDEDRKIGK